MSAGTILPLRLEAVAFEASGRTLIEPVTLDIARGPRSLLLGPNGSGKSLFLRLCHGLIRPSRGRVHWQGQGANGGGRSLLHRQAMVFQRPVMLRRSEPSAAKRTITWPPSATPMTTPSPSSRWRTPSPTESAGTSSRGITPVAPAG